VQVGKKIQEIHNRLKIILTVIIVAVSALLESVLFILLITILLLATSVLLKSVLLIVTPVLLIFSSRLESILLLIAIIGERASVSSVSVASAAAVSVDGVISAITVVRIYLLQSNIFKNAFFQSFCVKTRFSVFDRFL
jgi:hypothetical protein